MSTANDIETVKYSTSGHVAEEVVEPVYTSDGKYLMHVDVLSYDDGRLVKKSSYDNYARSRLLDVEYYLANDATLNIVYEDNVCLDYCVYRDKYRTISLKWFYIGQLKAYKQYTTETRVFEKMEWYNNGELASNNIGNDNDDDGLGVVTTWYRSDIDDINDYSAKRHISNQQELDLIAELEQSGKLDQLLDRIIAGGVLDSAGNILDAFGHSRDSHQQVHRVINHRYGHRDGSVKEWDRQGRLLSDKTFDYRGEKRNNPEYTVDKFLSDWYGYSRTY